MQTHLIEHRRDTESPWMPVTTVQDDLLDDIMPLVPTEPGEWRVRPENPEPRHPVAPQRKTVRFTVWDRVKWWAMFRFSKRARG
ncbi:MAG: hypothetical protein BGN97_03625 [Microbacterium sp. 69-10]|nr:MAG: hypothetical protein BGN97_03625 [Microbacterium sp. 69-10]